MARRLVMVAAVSAIAAIAAMAIMGAVAAHRASSARRALERPGYLRVEVRSRVFRFVDDVEVQVDAVTRVYRMRSAARLGRRDFGVNRQRIERVSARLAPPGA